jgi:hypothetical protein
MVEAILIDVVVEKIVRGVEREQTVVIARRGIHSFAAVSFVRKGNKVVDVVAVAVVGDRTSSRTLGYQE